MKAHDYIQDRPGPGGVFDNALAGRIMVWMHPSKAIRTLIAVATFAVLTGCETSADSVPKQTVVTPSAENIVLIAQTAPVGGAAPAEVATTNQPAIDKKDSTIAPTVTTNAVAAPEPKPDTITTNETPAIQEEVAPTIPSNLKISEATEKIIKLAQGGVDENVMLVFVGKTQDKFDLGADEIVYLSDLGVPSSVLTAMLKKDGVDPSKVEQLTAANNTEVAQPDLPQANAIGQPVEITTNYVPTTVVQQAPPQQVVVEQPQTVVVNPQPETVSYFYDSLSPYGSWFVTPEYGWCWQPTVAVVDRGWRPYGHRGRWIYSTSGWYWHSDYSWGWAPFHYGRWHLAGHRGWIWVPDRVWGPAWVSWRTADDYCGWAPLPPSAIYNPGYGFSYYGSSVGVSFGFGLGADAYCFAPVGYFHHRNVWNYCQPGYRSHHIYNRSYVHNRYDWDRNHHHPINNGIPRRQIERAINRELRPVPVREAPSQQMAGRVGIRDRVERNGNDSVIVRPSLPARSQIGNAVRASTTTPQPGATTAANIGGSNARFNRSRGAISEAAVVPSPSPSSPAQLPGRSSRAERTITPTAPATATPAPAVTQQSVENRIGASRRDRVFGSTSPTPGTTVPSPAVPTTPAPTPSGREIVRRDVTSRPATATPTTPAPSSNVRSDIGRNIQTGPRVQTTTPAPAPRFNAPSSQPQPITPSARMATPESSRSRVVTPQSVAPNPRYSSPTPQPQQSAPARSYSAPAARTPHYSPPPAAQSVPRSAPPAASPAPANRGQSSSPAPSQSRSSSSSGGGDRGSFSRDVQNRIGR